MELLQIKFLNSLNYWSNYWSKLIVCQIDLPEYEKLPADLFPDFSPNLENLIPCVMQKSIPAKSHKDCLCLI